VNRPQIREATLRDAAELADLVKQLGYATSPSEMKTRLEAILEDPDYHTLVADSGARLAGLVGVRLGRYYEKNGTFAQIAALVVREAERGTGVGALLLREAEAWAALRGAADVWVNSHRRRQEAHQFYEAHGYQSTGFRFRKLLEPAA
jgi:GNAT superfamily N-acetyltransferase